MRSTSLAPPVCAHKTLVHEQSTKDTSEVPEVLIDNSSTSNMGAQPVSPMTPTESTEEPAKVFAAGKEKAPARASTTGSGQLEEKQLDDDDLFGSEGSKKDGDELSEEFKELSLIHI